ncbi:MAG: hypothetical protein MI867_11330 [Pseudomonadales bacterium]|nr:hypothetical protein [Pseudomonadales bacterium]
MNRSFSHQNAQIRLFGKFGKHHKGASRYSKAHAMHNYGANKYQRFFKDKDGKTLADKHLRPLFLNLGQQLKVFETARTDLRHYNGAYYS